MFGLVLLVIFIIALGYFISKIPKVGAPITAIGAIILVMTGGWIGGIVWLFFAWNAWDKETRL